MSSRAIKGGLLSGVSAGLSIYALGVFCRYWLLLEDADPRKLSAFEDVVVAVGVLFYLLHWATTRARLHEVMSFRRLMVSPAGAEREIP